MTLQQLGQAGGLSIRVWKSSTSTVAIQRANLYVNALFSNDF